MIRYQPAITLLRRIVYSVTEIREQESAGPCTKCCYVGVPDGQQEGKEKGERKGSAGGEKTDLEESLRGSVGNSGGRRVVNFRLHRRAPSRLPHPTLLYLPPPRPFSSSPFLPRIASFFPPAASSSSTICPLPFSLPLPHRERILALPHAYKQLGRPPILLALSRMIQLRFG